MRATITSLTEARRRRRAAHPPAAEEAERQAKVRDRLDAEFAADWQGLLREVCVRVLGEALHEERNADAVVQGLYAACRVAYRAGYGAGVLETHRDLAPPRGVES